MARLPFLSDTWNTIKEVDLRPLRQEALRGIKLSIVGDPGSGRSTLANQIRRDPGRPHLDLDTPVLILDLEGAQQAETADLIILIYDPSKEETLREQDLVRKWSNSGKRVLVFVNQFHEPVESLSISPWTSHGRRRVIWGSVIDVEFLKEQFVPKVIELLPDKLLSLGRFFPLFRVGIAHYLINDTCFTNSAYALSTGLAETIAVFNIPIAVTDMVILSKNQAFLAYKLGLAFGFSTRWQDYITEFGGVLGGGFLWREFARSLVGLIPIWGILPKAAIAYAGTYVVGNVVLQWYLTGRHVSKKQINQIYRQALARGRIVARNLIRKIPRPRLPRLSRLRAPKLLPSRTIKSQSYSLPKPENMVVCPRCERRSASDASFCQYCSERIKPGE